jgi:hypothetical protein
VALLLEVFVVSIIWMLRRLHVAADARREQVAIGIGARMGNGLLIVVLSWLVLGRGAPPEAALAFAAALTALFGLAFALLVARPEEAVIGYKG